jgi:23S rRNA (uridine2552-2'-O)-methyltransferase
MATSKRRKAKSRAWLDRQNKDPYVQKARKSGYRARAAYKLEEIDKKFRLIKPGQTVIDLGAAPGSWSQYAVKKIGDNGQLIMLDLLPFDEIEGADMIQGDFTEPETLSVIQSLTEGSLFDLVLSDMAPNITGIALQDQARYERLLESVLAFCETALRPGGNLLTKFFEGESAQVIRGRLKSQFNQLKTVKPDASRTHSKELYLLALNRK